jgi:plasmid stabilization system protein ParE
VTRRAVVLRERAKQDVRDTMRWYERARTGLGLDFASAVEAALVRIEAGAEAFPRVHGEVRRCLIGRPFRSYGVFFTVAANAVVVIAVLHLRTNPTRWRRRR